MLITVLSHFHIFINTINLCSKYYNYIHVTVEETEKLGLLLTDGW